MQPNARTRYIIIGMARSGTTATHTAVYGHPNVCAMADEFRVEPFFSKGVACFTVGGHNGWERHRNSYALFDAVTVYPRGAPDPDGKRLIAYCGTPSVPKQDILANGLKVAIPSAEDAATLVESLQKYYPDLLVIHVRRSDWVAQFASLQRAAKSGVWHTRDDNPTERPAGEKMHLDANQFANYLQMASETERHLLSLRQSHRVCEFSYEQDLAPNDPTAMHRVFEFLSLRPLDPTWMRLTKTAPPLEDFVANVDELRGMMAAHRS